MLCVEQIHYRNSEAFRIAFERPALGDLPGPLDHSLRGSKPQKSGLSLDCMHVRSQLKEPQGEEPLRPRQDPALGQQIIFKHETATMSGLRAMPCALSLAARKRPQTIPEQTGVTVVQLYL